jgi:hypothetical protein
MTESLSAEHADQMSRLRETTVVARGEMDIQSQGQRDGCSSEIVTVKVRASTAPEASVTGR